MHDIAARDEHAEQAFPATTELRVDGTRIRLPSEHHDSRGERGVFCPGAG